MNQTIQELFQRKSVRLYTDEAISEEEKNLIIESALQAPTAGNMTLYSIIDVTNQDLKEELAKRCDHQPFIANAPLVLIFLADYQKWYDMFQEYTPNVPKLEESDMILAMEDACIAAQNAVVAAESMGIGSCFIGDIVENYEDNRELLNLPKYALPIAMVVFGKPTEQQKKRQKPKRFKKEDIVYENCYEHKTLEETKRLFMEHSQKSETELEKYITAFAKRKFYAKFREEMNRSVRAMLKSWNS